MYDGVLASTAQVRSAVGCGCGVCPWRIVILRHAVRVCAVGRPWRCVSVVLLCVVVNAIGGRGMLSVVALRCAQSSDERCAQAVADAMVQAADGAGVQGECPAPCGGLTIELKWLLSCYLASTAAVGLRASERDREGERERGIAR